MRLVGAIGISTATGLLFAPGLTMFCWICLLLFAVVLVPYTIVCCMGAVAMLAYPWLVQKNWTLRWRKLLLHGGHNYRTMLISVAWVFQARPLYIVAFFVGVWTISRLTLTSPMKTQLDPLEILRDLRQGGAIIKSPIPNVILLSLCNLLTGATCWRMVLSTMNIILWWLKYHLEENYRKAISPVLAMILAGEFSWFDIVTLTYGEAMTPTFGDAGDDIKMPADGYCFYHCFNHQKSNGKSPPSRESAMRLQKKYLMRYAAMANAIPGREFDYCNLELMATQTRRISNLSLQS